MNFRAAAEKDLEGIWELLSLSFEGGYAYYARKSFTSSERVLVAEEMDSLWAVANWRVFTLREQKIGYLFWLAVHPEKRRTGLGERMVRETMEHIHEETSQAETYVTIEKKNLPSRRLFEKLGFQEITAGAFKKRYGVGSIWLHTHFLYIPGEAIYVHKKE